MKKAQIQMGETIAVLVIFFFILMMGMIFYVGVIKSKINEQKGEQADLEAITVMKRALTLSELHCSTQNIVRESCIDALKLQSAALQIRDKEVFYFDLFGFSLIEVQSVYPNQANFTVYNRTLELFSQKSVTNTPVTLFDPLSGNYAFGVLHIETFSQ